MCLEAGEIYEARATVPAPSPSGTEMDLVLLRAGKGDYLIQHHSALYFNEKTVHS